MKLHLKNIGILTDSQIEIAGISVIAGPNSTGKSTFGKALYAIFNAMYKFDKRLENAKYSLVNSVMVSLWINHKNTEDLFSSSKLFIDKLKEQKLSKERIKIIFDEFTQPLELSAEEASVALQKISQILLLDDQIIRNNVLLTSLRNEFGSGIQNIFHMEEGASIAVTISQKTSSINIEDNRVKSVQNVQTLDIQPVYIDDRVMQLLEARFSVLPYFVKGHAIDTVKLVLDNGEATTQTDDESVRQEIRQLLRTELIRPIYEKFTEICHGRIVKDKEGVQFKDEKNPGITFSIENLSAGLKVFLILQELVANGGIKERGTIILDEPEIHLHPEWQVIFAELLVVLQKTLKLHILLTTHSPYFVSALDVYSKKYRITDVAKFYFAKSDIKNRVSVRDVTHNLSEIYDSLAAPYQTIEDEAIKDANT